MPFWKKYKGSETEDNMEEKTTKRLYLWVGIAVTVVLCIVAGIFLMPQTPADTEERVLEPSVPPGLSTPVPTASPAPDPTPKPTQYMLPLLPVWDTPAPTPTVTPPPEADARAPALSGLGGRYDDACKDLLAVGIQNGMATAVLLVRLSGNSMTVTAIPCETLGTVYTLDKDGDVLAVSRAPLSAALKRGGRNEKRQLWNLVWAVKNTTGVSAAHFVALDLSCLEAVAEELGGLSGENGVIRAKQAGEIMASSGVERAEGMADIGVGLVRALSETAIWELPALQRLTKNKLDSGLTVRQLILLALSLKQAETIRTCVLPTAEADGARVLSYPDAENLLKKIYQ